MAEPSLARSGAPLALLGGRSPAAFLARYWQRRALLVRGAISGLDELAAFATRDRLFALARRDDVESRLVTRIGERYTLAQGPFRRTDLVRLPPRNWTLLVSGVNLEDHDADRLLRRFAFLPWARLDDLMVSIAAPGGGVGPHVDSYDVFLLRPRAGAAGATVASATSRCATTSPSSSSSASLPRTTTRWARETFCTCRPSTRTTVSPSTPA
jgi:50S ribosomal protein L16 3-hydroxylase